LVENSAPELYRPEAIGQLTGSAQGCHYVGELGFMAAHVLFRPLSLLSLCHFASG
jgi:hypothetical protein